MFAQLRNKREELYLLFDQISTPQDYYKIQIELAKNIIEAEEAIRMDKDKDDWQFHLDRIYSLGDAIAWLLINKFIIRQLSQYQSVRTSLIGQQGNFSALMESYDQEAKVSFYLFADLTRCITHGDIIKINSGDDINIIESKGQFTGNPSVTSLLSGRNGRQFSKTLWLANFLNSGFEVLYGKEKPTKTVEIDVDQQYHYHLLPELIDKCLEHGTALVKAEEGLVYLAQDLSSELHAISGPDLEKIKLRQPIVAGTARLVEKDRETGFHGPAMVFPIPLKYRILLQEVDINVYGILDVAYVSELAKAKGYNLSYNPNIGSFKLEKDGVGFNYHARFTNDIVINFQSVDTAVDMLIALYEKVKPMGRLSKEEEDHLQKRPKNKEELKTFLTENYVIAKLDENGNIIEAYNMNGESIY